MQHLIFSQATGTRTTTTGSNTFYVIDNSIKAVNMMETFQLDLHGLKQQRLRAYLFNLGLLSLPIVYDILFPNNIIKDSYYTFCGAYILVNLIKDLFVQNTFQVSFDSSNRSIILLSKSLLSKAKQKSIAFEDARLEYTQESSFLIFSSAMQLCFMKGKREVACLQESNNGFTKERIQEIVNYAEAHSIPITVI